LCVCVCVCLCIVSIPVVFSIFLDHPHSRYGEEIHQVTASRDAVRICVPVDVSEVDIADDTLNGDSEVTIVNTTLENVNVNFASAHDPRFTNRIH
jgi:hypothetical protein